MTATDDPDGRRFAHHARHAAAGVVRRRLPRRAGGRRRARARGSAQRRRPTSSSPTSTCPASTASASSSAFGPIQRFLGVPILVLTTESSTRKEEPGAPRRRHGLDRQAVRFGEARRRRPARGRLNSQRGLWRPWTRWRRSEKRSSRNATSSLPRSKSGSSRWTRATADAETVNAVFRAVHSIKGGAGAFQLDRLVRFAHAFETALDLMRSGKIAPRQTLLKTMFRVERRARRSGRPRREAAAKSTSAASRR